MTKIYYLTTDNKIYKEVVSEDDLKSCIKYYEGLDFKWSYNRKDLVKKLRAMRKEQRNAWKKLKKCLREKNNF